MADKAGVIYILTNPSFPEYVKIGFARDLETRLKQLNAIGYGDAREAAEDIAVNYDEIYENGIGLLLRNTNNATAYICIEPNLENAENDFYDIKTISPSNDRYFKNKKRLWKRPQPSKQ